MAKKSRKEEETKVKKSEKSEKSGKGERGKGGCTCIMNVAASKVRFGMHSMPASEASPCVRGNFGKGKGVLIPVERNQTLFVRYFII